MKRKYVLSGLMLVIAFVLVGAPGAFAYGSFLVAPLTTWGGSCGTCHVDPNGGGPRTPYGTLFESQANHRTDPAAALTAIGPPDTTPPTTSPTTRSTIDEDHKKDYSDDHEEDWTEEQREEDHIREEEDD